jgi:hypothetical protein
LLNEMATKQGRKFEEVFADPANRALAAATYTGRIVRTSVQPVEARLQR